MRQVHLVVPDGVTDRDRPSGGNAYDARLADELALAGWAVHLWEVAGDWPDAAPPARAALAEVLGDLADASLVVVDGLVASLLPEVVVPAARRLRLVVLLHMPLGGDRECAVLAAASAVVTTSEWSRQAVLARRSLSPERVHVATPGVDLGALAQGTADGTELLCVAALVPGKGHDVLVEALASIAEEAWTCRCVGSLVRDPGFVSGVRDRAARAGIEDRIAFTGPLTGDRLAASYGAADLLVLPTRGESFGMVLTEALAHGLPVVASDVGGVREAFGVAAPGVLVPPDDPAALAAALGTWLDDAELRRRWRDAALTRRATLGGWTETSAQVVRVLERVS